MGTEGSLYDLDGALASTIVPGVDRMTQGPSLGTRRPGWPFPTDLKAAESNSHSVSQDEWPVFGGVLVGSQSTEFPHNAGCLGP